MRLRSSWTCHVPHRVTCAPPPFLQAPLPYVELARRDADRCRVSAGTIADPGERNVDCELFETLFLVSLLCF
ncbi:hypothetical protein HBI56_093470 [Parastagonospora nodorum]|uniref:Uncharacterized protein n=1 Tax=Phaeosphaeria nodorum (strain SN15 / ATCC MYA-4574 / FGSC 10173) TaxID=321614 RepID=A0A7U2F3M0_PHANO|nr:hypothetical protein HBH56_088730 [Parastagonospora nodorum]QRC98080.1 hypothetical protein JI435_411410 [Parastagonospora nodorum SN15]KAH3936618.1 hypothetical protein HBH54_023370 [Parastagonospora nodorum]KAH3945661.1 hypothetical protein HBH53_140470 [Parastagonospora nodorum]KAH3966252.1 hypothetical protein HBH51_144900 [Parastagonospora nodorum]